MVVAALKYVRGKKVRPLLRFAHIKPTVEDHLGLVKKIAGKITRCSKCIEDTEEYADGLIGLMRACEGKFDNQFKFSTYASEFIRREIIDGIRRRNGKIVGMTHLLNEEFDIEDNPKKEPPVELVEKFFQPHPDDTQDNITNKQIMRMRLHGVSWKVIGKHFGFTGPAARKRWVMEAKLVRRRFRQEYENSIL
jgi:RNA polymerase sigma factor (sigma-70 family)